MESSRGAAVIILNNQSAEPLDPEVFRAAAARRALETRAPHPEGGAR